MVLEKSRLVAPLGSTQNTSRCLHNELRVKGVTIEGQRTAPTLGKLLLPLRRGFQRKFRRGKVQRDRRFDHLTILDHRGLRCSLHCLEIRNSETIFGFHRNGCLWPKKRFAREVKWANHHFGPERENGWSLRGRYTKALAKWYKIPLT